MTDPVRILSADAPKGGLRLNAETFSRETGIAHEIELATGPVIKQRVLAGEAGADIVVIPRPEFGDLVAAGRLAADDIAVIGLVTVGVTIKLSFAFLGLFAVLVAAHCFVRQRMLGSGVGYWQAIRRNLAPILVVAVLAGVVLGTWLVRGAVMTGYVAYPSNTALWLDAHHRRQSPARPVEGEPCGQAGPQQTLRTGRQVHEPDLGAVSVDADSHDGPWPVGVQRDRGDVIAQRRDAGERLAGGQVPPDQVAVVAAQAEHARAVGGEQAAFDLAPAVREPPLLDQRGRVLRGGRAGEGERRGGRSHVPVHGDVQVFGTRAPVYSDLSGARREGMSTRLPRTNCGFLERWPPRVALQTHPKGAGHDSLACGDALSPRCRGSRLGFRSSGTEGAGPHLGGR